MIGKAGQSRHGPDQSAIRPGAECTGIYLPRLEGKKVGIVANHASRVGEKHLVDSLVAPGGAGIEIVRLFGPEHGFEGRGEDAVPIEDQKDTRWDIPVLSLYGPRQKPSAEDLRGLDLILFDLQDVGVRFYTYLSTLHYLMQACAENGLELVLLDRPNPNGFYVDGPVLEAGFRSFFGLHEVPVVYGMTIGEYALMINGEGWLGPGLTCKLSVVPCEHYTHRSSYRLPVPPSPNLPTMNAVYLYPSVCFFEGTVISEGRGTDSPFEVFGHPDLMESEHSFIPLRIPGTDSHPKWQGKTCHGRDLRYLRDRDTRPATFNLSWLIWAYRNFPAKEFFFTPFFEKLAGTARLRQQIIEGRSEEEIRASWAKELKIFRKIRSKYLIYPD
jgi:uncharacterized protein YbbC (DUF1343 family)